MASNNRNSNLIWLEHSGVWARVPQREPVNDNAPYKRRKLERRPSPEPSADISGDDIAKSDGEEVCCSTCSICLDEVPMPHRAVLNPCMHEFHHTCISTWLKMKPECPLCKSQVLTILHNIRDDGSFLERKLHLPTKIHVTNREDIMRRLTEILGEGLNDLIRHQGGSNNREHRLRQQRQSHTADGRRIDAHGNPTPYSMRVQHHSNSTRRRTTTPTATRDYFQNYRHHQRQQEDEQEEAALIAWRREIYDLELYAIPLGTHHHVPRSLVAPAGRQNRIKEWVQRELHALLETEHTTILRGFVMGLLATYGAHPPLPPSHLPPAEILATDTRGENAEEERGGAPPGQGDDPVSQLRPFLLRDAAHFWHELSCFATAPAYTIRTYDSIVRYGRPGEAPRQEKRRREESGPGEILEDDGRSNRTRRRRRRSYSRSRSPSRLQDGDSSGRKCRFEERGRRREEEEEEEEEAEQTEDSRWEMWKWGDPIDE